MRPKQTSNNILYNKLYQLQDQYIQYDLEVMHLDFYLYIFKALSPRATSLVIKRRDPGLIFSLTFI